MPLPRSPAESRPTAPASGRALPESPPAAPFAAPFAELRRRYQAGLLAWLSRPESGEGLAALCAALAELGALADTDAPLWQAAEMLFSDIAAGRRPAKLEYRRLAGRIDQHLRQKVAAPAATTDDGLLAELRALLAREKSTPPAAAHGADKRHPLATTLEATAAVLPFLQPRPRRFAPEQRREWDAAVAELRSHWPACARGAPDAWPALRAAIFRLLAGALPLPHPAPLALAEALAAATDDLERVAPTAYRRAALAASFELLGEADFLEHPALAARVTQLVERLGRRQPGARSPRVDALFAAEAREEIEALCASLETVPPDTRAFARAAGRLQALAEPLDLPALAEAARRLGDAVARLDPGLLDEGPGRAALLAGLAALSAWIDGIGDGQTQTPLTPLRTLDTTLAVLGKLAPPTA